MAALFEWLKALVWSHGGRRLVVTALPTAFVTALTLINNFIKPLPSDPALAILWQPHWWTWALAVEAGLIVASYLAWLEQRDGLNKLAGRPELSMLYAPSVRQFIVRNSSTFSALNVTAKEIVIDVPQEIAQRYVAARIVDETGAEKAPEQWRIDFDSIDCVIESDIPGHALGYTIHGMGVANNTDGLDRLFLALTEDGHILTLPLVLIFHNLGSPKKTWHSHYELQYKPLKQFLACIHQGIDEVREGTSCSRCVENRGRS